MSADSFDGLTEPWSAHSRDEAAARARVWWEGPALARLVGSLGGPLPVADDAQTLVAWTASMFDTRHGAERRDAAAATWDEGQVAAVLAAAGPLGLMASAPPSRGAYEAGVVLGGATTGNRLRVRLAAELTAHGVKFGELVGLGAERPLGDLELTDEPESAEDETEWRNLLRNLNERFGPLTPARVKDVAANPDGWRNRMFSRADVDVRLVVAPASLNGRRPSTVDAITFYMSSLEAGRPSSILLVTSAIYIPYQFFAVAPTLLDEGIAHVEIVGTSTAPTGAPLLAQRLGQEIHAAVESAARLLDPRSL